MICFARSHAADQGAGRFGQFVGGAGGLRGRLVGAEGAAVGGDRAGAVLLIAQHGGRGDEALPPCLVQVRLHASAVRLPGGGLGLGGELRAHPLARPAVGAEGRILVGEGAGDADRAGQGVDDRFELQPLRRALHHVLPQPAQFIAEVVQRPRQAGGGLAGGPGHLLLQVGQDDVLGLGVPAGRHQRLDHLLLGFGEGEADAPQGPHALDGVVEGLGDHVRRAADALPPDFRDVRRGPQGPHEGVAGDAGVGGQGGRRLLHLLALEEGGPLDLVGDAAYLLGGQPRRAPGGAQHALQPQEGAFRLGDVAGDAADALDDGEAAEQFGHPAEGGGHAMKDLSIFLTPSSVMPVARFISRSSWVASALIRSTSSPMSVILFLDPLAEFDHVLLAQRGVGVSLESVASGVALPGAHHVPGGGFPELRRRPAEPAEAEFLVLSPGEAGGAL